MMRRPPAEMAVWAGADPRPRVRACSDDLPAHYIEFPRPLTLAEVRLIRSGTIRQAGMAPEPLVALYPRRCPRLREVLATGLRRLAGWLR